MKKCLLVLGLAAVCNGAFAQITITAADMPVVGDTLRYSSDTSLNVNLTTGANMSWNFGNLGHITQGVDAYKYALQVNLAYGIISPTAYGYKVTDTLSLGGQSLPVSVTDVYTFFNKKTGPDRYSAEGYAAMVNGTPIPTTYSDEDEVYLFPETYGNAQDSTTYALNLTVPALGSLKQKGYRLTKVDGWGTITTPYFTTATSCLRIRSEIHEMDSVVSPLGSFPIPRNSVEYKWLVNGEHYPALIVTAAIVGSTETPTSVRYRDMYRPTAIRNVNKATVDLKAYPNPAVNGVVNLSIPAGWNNYIINVFDIQGREVASFKNMPVLDLKTLSSGNYMIRVIAGEETGYTVISK